MQKDMEYYLTHLWTLWTVTGPLIDNKRKIRELRNAEKNFFFIAKTANAGISKIVKFINKFPDFIEADYIKDWRRKVKNIFIVCDPVHRLLSDFKHVTSEWHEKKKKINRKFLGSESSAYPFQKLTFDKMVETYLPKVKNGWIFGDSPEIAEMFSTGLYGQPQKFFLGEQRVIEKENGLVLDGAKVLNHCVESDQYFSWKRNRGSFLKNLKNVSASNPTSTKAFLKDEKTVITACVFSATWRR